MRSSIVALVLVVAVGAMGSAISCWDYDGGDAVPVGTATPVPAPRAADVCGVGWEFGEWREVQSYSSLETCGAGGTRRHCTEDGLLEVEWIGEIDPCVSATATPSAESICGAGWEFDEVREIDTIYADEGCGAGGTRGRCEREGLFFVEWDGFAPGCLSATATASAATATPVTTATPEATATPAATATPEATATPAVTPCAESICGAGWEFGEIRDIDTIYAYEGCAVAGTRRRCTFEVLVTIEWDGEDPSGCLLSAHATATASAATATPVATTLE